MFASLCMFMLSMTSSVVALQPMPIYDSATYYILNWNNDCTARVHENDRSAAIWESVPKIVDIWNNEFMVELTPVNSTSEVDQLRKRFPMSASQFETCTISCATVRYDNRSNYDAYGMISLCQETSVRRPRHMVAILNAPLRNAAGLGGNSQIHISGDIWVNRVEIRPWLGVVLHEYLHGMALDHTLAYTNPRMGLYGDVLGAWLDNGFRETSFLNSNAMFRLGLVDPAHTVVLNTAQSHSDWVYAGRLPTIGRTKTKDRSVMSRIIVLNNTIGVVADVVIEVATFYNTYNNVGIRKDVPYIRVFTGKFNAYFGSSMIAMFPANSDSEIDLMYEISPTANGTYVDGKFEFPIKVKSAISGNSTEVYVLYGIESI